MRLQGHDRRKAAVHEQYAAYAVLCTIEQSVHVCKNWASKHCDVNISARHATDTLVQHNTGVHGARRLQYVTHSTFHPNRCPHRLSCVL
jgi:hypothetical protein